MQVPATKFTESADGVRIAYSEYGTGPPTLYLDGMAHPIDLIWELEADRVSKAYAAEYLRLLFMDDRGWGASEDTGGVPSLEDRALDMCAVTDAVGADRVSIIAWGPIVRAAVAFAALYPERVDRLVIAHAWGSPSMKARADELNPGIEELEMPSEPPEDVEAVDWSAPAPPDDWVAMTPSWADHLDDWKKQARLERLNPASPDQLVRLTKSLWPNRDIGDLIASVTAPTLVLWNRGNRLTQVGWAHAWAEALPDARVVELDGVDHHMDVGPTWRQFINEAVSFITDVPHVGETTLEFATLMFTDIVESSARSLELGDASWTARLEQHDRIVDEIVSRRSGEIVKHTGDGALAVFRTPSDAVKAGLELTDTLASLEIPIRVGVNTGEFERRGNDITGAVVNLTARVMDAAASGQVLATETVAEEMLGSRIVFTPTGEHTLKGFTRTRTLYEPSRP